MARWGFGAIETILHRRALARWKRVARRAELADLDELRKQRVRARALKQPLDRLIYVAESRLALPRIGSSAFFRPPGTDWSWRPYLWRGPLAEVGIASAETRSTLGEGVTLFHDCRLSEITLRQIRNQRAEDLAPYGLRLDVFRFTGSFLSLAIDLPPEACDGLKKRHLIRLDPIIEWEKPLEVFARLNIKHGPNTEQLVRELQRGPEGLMVEFDLAYTKLNEKRVDRIWLDLILEGPQMNMLAIRDLTLCRYPRAEI